MANVARPSSALDPRAGDLSHVRSTPLLSGLQLVEVLLALSASVLVAYRFGATQAADAFFMGQAVLLLFTKFLQSGPMANMFFPVYLRVKQEGGKEAAWGWFCNLLWTLALGTTFLAIILIWAGDLVVPLIAPGFDAGTQALTARVARVLFATVVTLPLSILLTSLLNARGFFVLPGVLALIPPAAYLGAVAWGAGRYGILALPWGILVGAFMHLAALALAVRWTLGLPWRWRLDPRQHELGEFMRQVVAFNLVVPFAQAQLFVSRLLLSLLPVGSVALIGYAERLTGYLSLLYTVPTTFLPAVTRRLARDGREEFKRFLAVNLNVANLFFFPLSLGVMILSSDLVKLLFERGAFEPKASRALSVILILFMIGFLVQGMASLFNRSLYALNRSADVIKARILVNIVTVAAYLAILMNPSLYGLTLIMGLSPLMFWLAYFWFLSRQVEGMVTLVFNGSLRRIALSAAMMAMALLASRGLDSVGGPFESSLLMLVVSSVLGLVVYGTCLILFRVSEVVVVKEYVRSRLPVAWGRGAA